MKDFSWRIPVIGLVLIVAVIYVIPTFKPGWWPNKQINLGLDLQGGMHLVLEVQTEKAVESTLERIRNELRTLFRNDKIRHKGIDYSGKKALSVKLTDPNDLEKVDDLLGKNYGDVKILSSTLENGIKTVKIGLTDEWVAQIKKQATEQALETIRNRIDQFGVSEPDIRVQGERRIQIQLPGIQDTERAKELIGKTALLEFKLLDAEHDLGAALNGNVPPGSEILYQATDSDTEQSAAQKQPYLVKTRTLMTGAYLTDARVQIDSQFNEPYVSIDFDRKGAKIFERITGENVKKRMAIVLDNKVYSAPTIQEKIPGGSARITGSFNAQEAHDLAIVLRAGSLPAPVEIIEERTVGPSLGHDSISKGLYSMVVGGILVLIFMFIYYKGAGLIADFALVLNILLIAGGLAAFQATLTLPGIAGIILTIGMAVDANVIIFERIREEMRLGKTPIASITTGFERASLTILDANVTTLIAALVLFQFGTGPVKGFAVTLSLGVLASLFTALIISRLIFDYLYISVRVKSLSI
ncbi:MAG: protein translocase subunit SecD [Desulfobacteraceae bacterium]|nr:protein translocase subunit SecD [Desulfobacteraceae bacterium]MBC2756413.1 protein translocase subunit SecD [Desulfobacteraceae bacterium]MBC2763543.1 protein translocase subunit SecD [ANME-2 cluster archaeon]